MQYKKQKVSNLVLGNISNLSKVNLKATA
ncbi:hypothetical protein SAST44_01824 [Staphylococcus aureus]|nr:hypothetical protein M140OLGA_1349 [Staphylococcus aureus subsp. aureus 112808A]QGQ75009.1 hypothetical protein SAST44_01824 [Staphylococcus aureus]QGQ78346.1 hypothetical protein SAST45_01802 [Staphylococcus aureus]